MHQMENGCLATKQHENRCMMEIIFGMRELYKNCESLRFLFRYYKINDSLQQISHAFLRLSHYIFIRAKNFLTKILKENRTRILYANTCYLQVSKFSR
jgi:hypothetical protein